MYSGQKRSELPELMDQHDADPIDISRALRELEIINKYLGGYKVLLSSLSEICKDHKSVSILDIGSGGGDNLRKVADWMRKNKIHATLTGVDINDEMTRFATSQSKNYPEIKFITKDVWDRSYDTRHDIVMSSLFCHHFNNDKLPSLLQRMKELSSKYIVVNDLHRHWFAYHSIRLITKYFSDNPLVRYDAPLSVARSLKRKEWESTLQSCGLNNYTITWSWAWRYKIIIHL